MLITITTLLLLLDKLKAIAAKRPADLHKDATYLNDTATIYCTVLYYTVLYCTVLYYTILCYNTYAATG